jgi:hypothetical protein
MYQSASYEMKKEANWGTNGHGQKEQTLYLPDFKGVNGLKGLSKG